MRQRVVTFLRTISKDGGDINAAICDVDNDEEELGSNLQEIIKRLSVKYPVVKSESN